MSYWVQIELEVNGKETSALQVDLADIKSVQFYRNADLTDHGPDVNPEYRHLTLVECIYRDKQQLVFHNQGALNFVAHWEKYQQCHDLSHGLKAKDPQAEPSLIVSAAQMSRIEQLLRR